MTDEIKTILNEILAEIRKMSREMDNDGGWGHGVEAVELDYIEDIFERRGVK